MQTLQLLSKYRNEWQRDREREKEEERKRKRVRDMTKARPNAMPQCHNSENPEPKLRLLLMLDSLRDYETENKNPNTKSLNK